MFGPSSTDPLDIAIRESLSASAKHQEADLTDVQVILVMIIVTAMLTLFTGFFAYLFLSA